MAHARFVFEEGEESGYLDWRLKKHPAFNSIDATGVAHDILGTARATGSPCWKKSSRQARSSSRRWIAAVSTSGIAAIATYPNLSLRRLYRRCVTSIGHKDACGMFRPVAISVCRSEKSTSTKSSMRPISSLHMCGIPRRPTIYHVLERLDAEYARMSSVSLGWREAA